MNSLAIFAFLVCVSLHPSLSSKFNPQVKLKKLSVKSVPATTTSPPSAPQVTTTNKPPEMAQGKHCSEVKCMSRPVHSEGSPECRPRYDRDSCCPTWICASDHHLDKNLFDKDNNWIHHPVKQSLYDVDEDEHHEDEEEEAAEKPEEHEHDEWEEEEEEEEHDTPPKLLSEIHAEKLEKFAARGKLDNVHNQNLINLMNKQEKPNEGIKKNL